MNDVPVILSSADVATTNDLLLDVAGTATYDVFVVRLYYTNKHRIFIRRKNDTICTYCFVIFSQTNYR